jgi:16S rRNA (cytosine1407-C5)-methyltransferase
MSNTPIISKAFLEHARASFLAEDQQESFVAACCSPLRKSIRVNTLKISVAEFQLRADALGLALTPIPWCKEGFWVAESNSQFQSSSTTENPEISSVGNRKQNEPLEPLALGNLTSHLQGLFYIQEASSMLPPQALFADLNSNQPLRVLDLAAAPGSKTTQMAALMANTGLLLANEISASRVKSLHANILRCGVSNTCLSQFDGRKLGPRLAGQFDLVLLDAPCGGEGTIRKDPKALEDWQLSKVEEIAELQKQLILTAYQCLKPGGRLVYSTCTLSPEENQQVANYLTTSTTAKVVNLAHLFEQAKRAITPEGYLHIQPQTFDSEGFFVSAFVKPMGSEELGQQSTVSSKKTKKNKGKSSQKWTPSFIPLERKLKNRLTDYLQNHFGIKQDKINGEIQLKDKQVWLLPKGSSELNQLVRLNRSGIKLAEIYPNKIRTHHEFAMALESCFSRQKLGIEKEQAEGFYQGKNIDLKSHQREDYDLKDGEVLLTYQGYAIGLASLNKNKLKNLLPRDLVKDTIKLN